MKNVYIPIIALLVIAVTSCDSSEKQSEPEAKWKTIDAADYSIQYPEEWKRESGQNFGTEFMLMSARTSSQDEFKENINLVIQDLSNTNLDLEKYTAISEEQIMGGMENAKIIRSERSNKHGETAQRIIYSGIYENRALKFEQYYWIKNSKAFVLTLTCEVEQFDDYKEVGEAILGSFRLK